MIILIITILYFLARYLVNRHRYYSGSYYQVTRAPYSSLSGDKGRIGEYLIYKHLSKLEASGGKFLFNVYIPKGADGTTEIDVLLITQKGLFVFESKNYSGWIFGSETQRNWTQTLPQGRRRSRKERFYNPIMQNQTHIASLLSLIGKDLPVWSIITFSERCTLKDISVQSSNVRVINRYDVLHTVSSILMQAQADTLTESEADALYRQLYPYTQCTEEVKAQHIAKINTTNLRACMRVLNPVVS